jgi:hypothetical protein
VSLIERKCEATPCLTPDAVVEGVSKRMVSGELDAIDEVKWGKCLKPARHYFAIVNKKGVTILNGWFCAEHFDKAKRDHDGWDGLRLGCTFIERHD